MKKAVKAKKIKRLTHAEEVRRLTEAIRGATTVLQRVEAASGPAGYGGNVETLVERIGLQREKASKYDAIVEERRARAEYRDDD